MSQQAWQVTGNVYQTISGKVEELPLPPATIRAMLDSMWKMVAAQTFDLRDLREEWQAAKEQEREDKEADRQDRAHRQWVLNAWLFSLTLAVLLLAFGLYVVATRV